MRTAVYIDGFNLYYRALQGTPYRWLDVLALGRQLVRSENKISLLRYFTARVKPNQRKPDQHVKQDAYLRALQAHIPNLHLHLGQFYAHKVRMPVANRMPGQPATVEVIKSEEKGSDVNLAVHLLNDAWSGAFDVALVISNDSDLAEAVRLARTLGRPIGVANPSATEKMCFELANCCSFKRRIETKHLAAAQLPGLLADANGRQIHKPTNW